MTAEMSKFHRQMLLVLGLLFFGSSALHLHGYSISAWHNVIDGSPESEILAGEARPIRSDDWLVNIPAIMAQREHNPRFPIRNSLYGEHKVLAAPSPLPSYTLFTLFRPHLWGYFVGMDFGLAWHWWFNALGLFYVAFLTGMLVSRGHIQVSILGAVCIVFSPFLQFWSLNAAPFVIFALAAALSGIHVLRAQGRLPILLGAGGVAYSGVGLGLSPYPPYQIIASYLALCVFIGAAVQYRAEATLLFKSKIVALCAAVAFVLGVGFLYYREISDVLSLILNTSYPGRRFELGGDQPWWRLFYDDLLPMVNVSSRNFFGNICEGAGFFLFVPVLAIPLFRRRGNPMLVGLCVFQLFVLTWMFVGFKPAFAKATLMSMVPTTRAMLGLGLAHVFFLAAYSATEWAAKRNLSKGLAIGWAVALASTGYWLSSAFQTRSVLLVFAIASLLSGVILYFILVQPIYALRILAAISVVATAGFNPITVGGSDFLKTNSLSKAIHALHRSGKESELRWIVFGETTTPNLLRSIGVPALNGLHFYPQFELWKELDPSGKYWSAYNRYAHIQFEPVFSEPVFIVEQPDLIRVQVSPDDPALERLKVGYFLARGDSPVLQASSRFVLRQKVGDYRIYARRLINSSDQAPLEISNP